MKAAEEAELKRIVKEALREFWQELYTVYPQRVTEAIGKEYPTRDHPYDPAPGEPFRVF